MTESPESPAPVARKWFQGDHYDIAMSKREQAIGFGAIAITLRELSKMAMAARRKRAAEPRP